MAAYFEVSVYLRDTQDRNVSLEIRNFRTQSLRLAKLDKLVDKDVQPRSTAKEVQNQFFPSQEVLSK